VSVPKPPNSNPATQQPSNPAPSSSRAPRARRSNLARRKAKARRRQQPKAAHAISGGGFGADGNRVAGVGAASRRASSYEVAEAGASVDKAAAWLPHSTGFSFR